MHIKETEILLYYYKAIFCEETSTISNYERELFYKKIFINDKLTYSFDAGRRLAVSQSASVYECRLFHAVSPDDGFRV